MALLSTLFATTTGAATRGCVSRQGTGRLLHFSVSEGLLEAPPFCLRALPGAVSSAPRACRWAGD
eukprot:12639570-Prorocentrum_lima.AAC.1